MIVYQSTKNGFLADAFKNDIHEVIRTLYLDRTGKRVGLPELNSWKESLICMAKVLNDDGIPGDCGVAIEFIIPQSQKRIDFILTGNDANQRGQVLIIELKQWTSAERTDKDAIVRTQFSGRKQDVSHPSYQAWSYAALLKGFNEAVYEGEMELEPCAYLYNYEPDAAISHPFYQPYIERAPVFLKGETERQRLREFIKKHVKYGDRAALLYKIENGRIRPSKALVDSLIGMIKGKQEFVLIDDQKVVYENAIAVAKQASSEQKKVFLVEGGPGTGKSVVAINLLVTLSKLGLVCKYVSKNAAPRSVYESKLAGTLRKTEISNLFSGSGAFTETDPNSFDVLIVDEAHRLNEKSGFYRNRGQNQVRELIAAAKATIFFLDEDQRVTLDDIGRREEIHERAKELGAKVTEAALASQFRCNGSDGYLAWLDSVLQIRETANETLRAEEFDFRVFNSPEEVRRVIVEKNRANNKARMVAGYCWPWNSKKNPRQMDVVIPEHEFSMRWNLTADGSLWIVAPNSVEEIGCIHTSQGLEVDYVGVVVGPDFIVRNGVAITRPEHRARRDQSVRGYQQLLREDPIGGGRLLDQIIKNTYRTLMTRGMKGCYVYFTDKETAEYFRARVAQPAAPQKISTVASPSISSQLEPFTRISRDLVKPFENAIPLLDLKFAAGAFGDVQSIDHENYTWVQLPDYFRPTPGLFVAKVVGESMNRRIKSGSWCLFKANPSGTKEGRVVVAQHRSIHDPDVGGSFTVKLYFSEKEVRADGSWRHKKVVLRPDSDKKSFNDIVLSGADADSTRIIAEFIAVLD